LARYRAQNRLLRNMLENRSSMTRSGDNVRSSGSEKNALNGPIRRAMSEHARSNDDD
jgi:hypothetical protein